MNNDTDRINNCKNSVGPGGMGLGKNNAHALPTKSTSVYRTTGFGQIADIINCGHVRTKGYGSRAKRVGEIVYWSLGGEKLFYYNKRPILESTIEKVKDGQIGAIPIDDLEAIWIFNENEERYENQLSVIKKLYIVMAKENTKITKEEIAAYFNKKNENYEINKKSIR